MTSTELAPENYADAALTAFDYGTLVAAVAEEMRGHASRSTVSNGLPFSMSAGS